MDTGDTKGREDIVFREGTYEGSTPHTGKVRLRHVAFILHLEVADLFPIIPLQDREEDNIEALECVRAVRRIGEYDNVVLLSVGQKVDRVVRVVAVHDEHSRTSLRFGFGLLVEVLDVLDSELTICPAILRDSKPVTEVSVSVYPGMKMKNGTDEAFATFPSAHLF